MVLRRLLTVRITRTVLVCAIVVLGLTRLTLLWSVLFDAQKEDFVVPAEMSKYRLCEIADGGHFFVHDATGNNLAKVEAKLKELQDKVGLLLAAAALRSPSRGCCVVLVCPWVCTACFRRMLGGRGGEAVWSVIIFCS